MHHEDALIRIFRRTCAILTLSQTSLSFNVSVGQVFKNTIRKGEIALNEQFNPFVEYTAISSNVKLSFANSLGMEESFFFSFGKGLIDVFFPWTSDI